MIEYRRSCVHFTGDSPCRIAKASPRRCRDCGEYSPRGARVLIIKTGSAGDVLRTTSVLKALREKYPGAQITWVVEEKNIPVLDHNPLVDKVLVYNAASLAFLQTVKFDIAVNLDVTMESSALESVVHARTKKGFTLDTEGVIRPVNIGAVAWYNMSLSDELKKKNKDTYHDMIHDICGMARNKNRPVLVLSAEDEAWAASFAKEHGLAAGKPVVAVNVGGGGRWELKSPGHAKWSEIVGEISSGPDLKVLLLGGPKDEEKYQRVLSSARGKIIDAGTRNTFGRFAALIGICDVLVTPDTLALHAGTALGKKIVALFGPTSMAEIELYGKGKKISSSLDCLCCYRKACDKKPDCMMSLDAGEIAGAVKGLLNG